jgi:hypothetical protein
MYIIILCIFINMARGYDRNTLLSSSRIRWKFFFIMHCILQHKNYYTEKNTFLIKVIFNFVHA